MNLSDLRRHQKAIAPPVSRGVAGFFRTRRQKEPSQEGPSITALFRGGPAAAFAGAFLGCLATLHLSVCGFVPAIASALATILLCGPVLATRTASLFSGEFFTAVYGGSFAGMTSVLWLSEGSPERSVLVVSALFILLSIVCGLAFWIVAEIDIRAGRRIAGGYGGRSGAIAAAASFIFVELAPLFGADNARFQAHPVDMFDLEPRLAALSFAACLIGMAATMLVLRRQSVATAGTADRTLLASAIALMGLIALHLNDPNDTRTADAFYAGCFLGMSTPDRLKGWIQAFLGVIALTAILVPVSKVLSGVGGSLGFAAFVTVTALVALNGMLGGGRSRESATQEAASGRQLQLSTYTTASPMFGIGNAHAIVAGSIVGLLVAGWFLLPYQLASQENAAETAPVAEQPAPIPAAPALVQAKPGTDDEDSTQPDQRPTNVVDADRAAATVGHPETEVAQTAAGGATADVAKDVGRADRAEATAMPNTAQAEATAMPSTAQGGVPIDAETYREFKQWEAARFGAQAGPQPVERARNPKVHLVRLVPTASSPQARPGRRSDRSSSASGREPAGSLAAGLRIDPWRPVRNSGIAPASGQPNP
jgi:hypothetical protein